MLKIGIWKEASARLAWAPSEDASERGLALRWGVA